MVKFYLLLVLDFFLLNLFCLSENLFASDHYAGLKIYANIGNEFITGRTEPGEDTVILQRFYDSTITFPDSAFLDALIGEGVDTNGDHLISYTEAEAVISLDVSKRSISDLTGIEAFVNLDTLNCNWNTNLTDLDVSKNVALKVLNCEYDSLTSLDVSKNGALTILNCQHNKLTSLNVSDNIALVDLICNDNLITGLDLSKNTSLNRLYCRANELTSLDLPEGPALTYVSCSVNPITGLDVSKCSALLQLHCQKIDLFSLDVSNNTALTHLICNYASLTSLDVSHNIALIELRCNKNQLTNLDVSNNINLTYLNCPNNLLTSLDLSKNKSLTLLNCFNNQFTSLDLCNNASINSLNLSHMPTLQKVKVWDSFPDRVLLYYDLSPNIDFVHECTYSVKDNQEGISIYPNPTNSLLTIRTVLTGYHTIEIRSLDGQLLYNEDLPGKIRYIDISPFIQGVYFVTVRSEAFVRFEKIIKL